ncbi:Hypothetical protein R9X50_00722700 [Acrodontium crateriforme]|uniref:SMODS and SLOG-associating 2TM effector domain-containing protein n=1 Tax=Acrodontium crateriforme TaxID=150365 RepID=A0AAQ3MBH0_9PEZI|nr:Hypothetical protein R9X50_00722700 [Acrodontium crateriforme]
MHELPSDLANSLRSWRGSIYGSNGAGGDKADQDLEKAADYGSKEQYSTPEDHYGEGEVERALKNSSSIENPKQEEHVDSKDDHNGTYDKVEQLPSHSQSHVDRPLYRSRVQQPTGNPQSNGTIQKTLIDGQESDDLDPAADRLGGDTSPLSKADFYELMGMQPPISKSQNPKQLSSRHGLYGRIHYDLEYVQTKYRIYDILVYAFLILQLFLSAVFIILGSLTRNDSHIAIAVLGAVSTVVAGTLALMKGQGLPNRLRQTRDSLSNVIFSAEELYWDVGADRSVYYKDVKKIREDYLKALAASRRNHPDTWNATATGMAQGITTTQGNAPTVAPEATPRVK